jgi:hypothetical protein
MPIERKPLPVDPMIRPLHRHVLIDTDRAVERTFENELSQAIVGDDPSDSLIEALANEVGQ